LVAIVETAGGDEIGFVVVGSVVEVVGGIDRSRFAGSEQLTSKLDQTVARPSLDKATEQAHTELLLALITQVGANCGQEVVVLVVYDDGLS
jgi:hypothetical protein